MIVFLFVFGKTLWQQEVHLLRHTDINKLQTDFYSKLQDAWSASRRQRVTQVLIVLSELGVLFIFEKQHQCRLSVALLLGSIAFLRVLDLFIFDWRSFWSFCRVFFFLCAAVVHMEHISSYFHYHVFSFIWHFLVWGIKSQVCLSFSINHVNKYFRVQLFRKLSAIYPHYSVRVRWKEQKLHDTASQQGLLKTLHVNFT